jgi:integrase/recombinase XerC
MPLSSINILSLSEISQVIAHLRRSRRREPAMLNLALFRLSACCGLRVAELTGLTIGDVKVGRARPHILVRESIAKGKKERVVPLWWDAGTLADLELYRANRVEDGAGPDDPFLCSTRSHRRGSAIGCRTAQQRWERIIRIVLGDERADGLSIHKGRHSFCSNALNAGKSLVEVRDAAGHSSVATTNVYLHLASSDETVGNIFEQIAEGVTA